MDEVGRGPLAGPVVAGAVLLHQHSFRSEIDDSKLLTPRARQKAFREILRLGSVGVGVVFQEEIDRIGIQAATHQAMTQALRRLPRGPELVLIDGLTVPSDCPFPALPVVNGDARSLSIACASIVAKVLRDRWMNRIHRIHPEYGFRHHKGYGTEHHLRMLSLIGPSSFHRYSFQPVKTVEIDE